jgi:hypothetical protein
MNLLPGFLRLDRNLSITASVGTRPSIFTALTSCGRVSSWSKSSSSVANTPLPIHSMVLHHYGYTASINKVGYLVCIINGYSGYQRILRWYGCRGRDGGHGRT